jgi:tetratricopeptide (TPR) repeat protein
MTSEKNYDYAHTMFAECVLHNLANLTYVEALLRNLRAQQPHPKKKIFAIGRGAMRPLKQAADHQEWSKVMRLGLDQLKVDPWDIVALRTLAQACAHFHYNEVELVYLKQALEANPRDLEVNRHCARSLARMGQFDQAIACWHRIETLRPGDREAPQMIAKLGEEKFKYPGGRPEVEPQPSVAPVVSAPTEEESVRPTLTPRQQLERAIAEDPKDASNYLELANLLVDLEHFQEAELLLSRGVAACGEHTALRERLNDIQMLRAQQEAEIAEARRKEIERRNRPFRMPWMEIVLVAAGFFLILQVFPAIAVAMWKGIDFRQWSLTNWFEVNIAAILVLIVLRSPGHASMPWWVKAIVLSVAFILVLQLFPAILSALDVRNWSVWIWIVANVLVLLGLLTIRLLPEGVWRKQEQRLSASNKKR